jgi:CRP-like cAMP-binding protein
MVLGRRVGEEPRWRRWVYFNVDYRYAPTQVIELVTRALRARPIEHVAATPEPNCVLMDFQESSARYAVRYHLMNFHVDDPTDSIVRTRVYYALTRAGIPLAIPAHTVFMTEDSTERRVRKREADSERRVKALARIEFFRDLSDTELEELAASMHRAPFAPGEVLTHQGAEAHHLYIVDRGRVSVRIRQGEREREVSTLGDIEFFGERSLLTGERRSATVVALTDVECYRLDADAFRGLLEKRPDLANKIAEQLAERRVELVATTETQSDRQSRIERDTDDLLHKIRDFFGL